MASDPASPTRHQPVLLREVLDQLQLEPGAVIVDGTFGGGGHTRAIAERIGPTGRVIAVDRDPSAVARAESLAETLPITPRLGNYCDVPEILRELGLETVDGILLDLGLSSDQLADDDRGFSFQSTGPLDLRFDPSRGEPAWRLLEHINERALADLIYRYGEERYSRRIARAIVERRRKREPIRTAADLADLIRRCLPRQRGRIDPATRTFQALRIAV
ncbi:MAG: 16S rRNA (cytosine(1402)-N(4))-methyltransferase, partial [Planctomycetota bacterium]